ncbi:hypothetical protein CGLO_05910 [Colletotrichum gloeosporioides Cg-14]|uniref:Uncharacterized protein n=1 Tax=Colletotrichum gloeosporioides (strain Cg-14) TaxID=1237896 RepID=T0KFR1_COLGC|nr:hypothetical protein CGLO_05910 [Colletotrichum gloeosporioides Cg-14]
MYQPIDGEYSGQPQVTAIKNRPNVSQETSFTKTTEPSHTPSGSRNKESHGSGTKRKKRLSVWIKFNLLISLLALAGAVAFISWLWWAPHEDVRWREWVLTPNRLQLSITLAAVVIRTAIGVLAGLATAMAASAAVERRGVHLHAIAQASVARFSSDGPLSLGLLALRGSSLDGMVRAELALLILTTLASQFTSSLLVSDLEERRVISFPSLESNAYTFVRRPPLKGVAPEAVSGYAHNYWFQRPRFTETFAEYSDDPVTGEGLDDTGPSVRAFLPLASQEDRESILEFQGMARVIDSRVICLRPRLSNLRPCQEEGEASSYVSLCGSVELDDTAAAADVGVAWSDSMNFNFTCPITAYENPYNWQLCAYQTQNWTSFDWSLHNTTRMATLRLIWDAGRIVRSAGSISVNGTAAEINSTVSGPWTHKSLRITNPSSKTGKREHDISFQMTMCASFAVYPDSIQYLNVSASSASNRTEPLYVWDVVEEAYNTSAVRKQLGAVKNPKSMSHDDRQVLTINKESLELTIEEARDGSAWQKYYSDPSLTWFYDRVNNFRRPYMPIALCPNCPADPSSDDGTADIIYARLFEDAMDETQSPARSLQVIYFTLARVVYYDFISSFAPNIDAPGADTASLVIFQLTSLPWRFRGYLAVLVVIAVFLATFAATAWLFRSTRFSFPENAWHTVAQISESPELANVLREAKASTDNDVESFMESYRNQESMRRSTSGLASFFTFNSKSQAPRFVVREGVFIRATGGQADMELQETQSRRRLTRQSSDQEISR